MSQITVQYPQYGKYLDLCLDGVQKISLTATECLCLEAFCLNSEDEQDCITFARGQMRSVEFASCGPIWTVIFKDLTSAVLHFDEIRKLGEELMTMRIPRA